MNKNASSANLTRDHFFETARNALSSRALERCSMTDLERQSQKGRSVLYYHFGCMEDFYFDFFEEKILKEIIADCSNFDELAISVVDYILENKILSINFYRLSKVMDHPDYLLRMCSTAFNEYELTDRKLQENQGHLMGGVIHTLQTWFDKELKTSRDEVIQQLHEHGRLLKKYLDD